MRTKQSGFTLVEVLVVAPVVLLFIGVFIGLLITLTGDSLVGRERNIVVYDTQSALNDIQSNVTQSTGFLATTGALPSPQGKDDAVAAFTDTTNGAPDTLILKLAAATKSPEDPTRTLIYTGSGACSSTNPLYTYYAIYFVDLDPDTADTLDKALFKRIVLPTAVTCAVPWQRGSCSAAAKAAAATSNPCARVDEKLVGGVTNLDIKYAVGSGALSDTYSAAATSVQANISIAKQVAGSGISYSSQIRATSVNIQ